MLAVVDSMPQSEYVPLILTRANDQNLDKDVKRLLVAFEIIESRRDFYGVDYIAQEFNMQNSTAKQKVDAFIDDVLDNQDVYQDQFEEIEEQYAQEIDQLLRKHD